MPDNLNELDQKIEVPVVVHSLSLRAQCAVQQVLGENRPSFDQPLPSEQEMHHLRMML